MNAVLETTRFVVDSSKSVKIDHGRIVEYCRTFQHGNTPHWLSASPITYSHLSEEDTLNFLLLFNSTSFCYWGSPKWAVEYKGRVFDGSWAMIAALIRAIDGGIPILNSRYRSKISKEEYGKILEGTVEIPQLEERWKITREVASVLLQKYPGNFAELVLSARNDGPTLRDLITADFPSFKDVRTYQNRTIYFFKRAQLLVADIHQTFGGEGYGNLSNIDQLTACADYKLPQCLRKLGIISYTNDLAEKIDNLVIIPENSVEEVEIRANTIWAVEMMKIELERQGRPAMSIGINDHLWLLSQSKAESDKPYHRTITTSY